MPFPIEQRLDEPARITKPIEPIGAVLDEHLSVRSWQSIAKVPSRAVGFLDGILLERARGTVSDLRNDQSQAGDARQMLQQSPRIIADSPAAVPEK